MKLIQLNLDHEIVRTVEQSLICQRTILATDKCSLLSAKFREGNSASIFKMVPLARPIFVQMMPLAGLIAIPKLLEFDVCWTNIAAIGPFPRPKSPKFRVFAKNAKIIPLPN